MNDSKAKIPPLSRKELQSHLKQYGIRAVGSTEVLRTAYQAHQSGLSPRKVSSIMATQSPSRNDRKPAAAASNRNKKKKRTSPEKRLRKFRSTCSQQTRARINRAKTQRLYLVSRGQVTDDLSCEFVVLGSTGNVYTVTIGRLSSCTCPDHQKGNLCKHILFILLKVMGIDPNSPLAYQVALLSSELEEMFQCMTNRRVGGTHVLANEQVRSRYAASLKSDGDVEDANTTTTSGIKRKSLEQDADCPICFDSLASGKLTYCRVACGTNFHEDCIQRWCGQHRANPTCPNCRQPWQSAESFASPTKEGYTNLGQLQGLPAERDTSTYSNWSPYSYRYKRRR